MSYQLLMVAGEVVQCESCNFPAPTEEFRGSGLQLKRRLCEFCATTMASRYTEFPSTDEMGFLRAEIWRAAAGVFNMIEMAKSRAQQK